MKKRHAVPTGSELVTQALMALPENGVTSEFRKIEDFLALVSNQDLMASLEDDLRRLALTRARLVRRHVRRYALMFGLVQKHIGYYGACTSDRHRDTFLKLALDPIFLQGLPIALRLEAQHRVYMIEHARQQAA
jgi:hypothetical protein